MYIQARPDDLAHQSTLFRLLFTMQFYKVVDYKPPLSSIFASLMLLNAALSSVFYTYLDL